MHVAHQEHARGVSADISFSSVLRSIAPAGERAFEAPRSRAALSRSVCSRPIIQGAAVRQALVVEVDRVLRCQHAAEAEGAPASATSASASSTAGSRSAGSSRRSRPCRTARAGRGAARLRAHPADHLVQHQRHDEHALGIGEVPDRQHRDPRFALGVNSSRCTSSGSPFGPGREAGRGQQVVDRHRQREAVPRREEGVEVERADLCRTVASAPRRSAGMSSAPPRQALSRMFASRMCSRLCSGSASRPSDSRPETTALTRSRSAAESPAVPPLPAAARNERSTDSGRPVRRRA